MSAYVFRKSVTRCSGVSGEMLRKLMFINCLWLYFLFVRAKFYTEASNKRILAAEGFHNLLWGKFDWCGIFFDDNCMVIVFLLWLRLVQCFLSWWNVCVLNLVGFGPWWCLQWLFWHLRWCFSMAHTSHCSQGHRSYSRSCSCRLYRPRHMFVRCQTL